MEPFLLISFVLEGVSNDATDSGVAGFTADGTPDDMTRTMLEREVCISGGWNRGRGFPLYIQRCHHSRELE